MRDGWRGLLNRRLGPGQISETFVVYQMLKGRRGVMLDVGAHHGSALAPFARDGWRVHAFEPDPANRAQLEERYASLPCVRIIPEGVSDSPGELPLYTSEESTGISSLAPFTEGHRATATVKVTTLADYIAEQEITTVDFLKIDVEGFERQVLRGHNWSVAPHTIVLEFEDSKTMPLGYSWTDLADDLVGRGYELMVSEWYPIERYGVSHQWRRFAPYPTILQHPAAWGNLIATRDPAGLVRATRATMVRYRIRKQLERLVRGAEGLTSTGS